MRNINRKWCEADLIADLKMVQEQAKDYSLFGYPEWFIKSKAAVNTAGIQSMLDETGPFHPRNQYYWMRADKKTVLARDIQAIRDFRGF